MNLIRLLLRTSWLTVSLAILTGLISGISSTALIALINLTLAQSPGAIATIIWSFIGLCLLMLVTNIFSQVLLSQLSQGAIYEMRMRLSQRILASPLRQLEEMGAPRLIAVLTDDIQSVSIAFFSIPIFCTNIAVFATCLIYLATVSWSVSLLMLVILVLGVGSFQVLINRGRVALDLAREEQDQLFQHLRSLTEGIKELKLHFQRQQAFLTEELKNSAIASRNYNIASAIAFSIAGSWGLALIFISLGLLIFVIPKFIVVESATLSSYALVSLYLVLPLQIILNTIPILNRAMPKPKII
jgi:putative ATP-binding cassette transporter